MTLDAFEIVVELGRQAQRPFEVTPFQLFFPVYGKLSGRGHGVTDLSTVHFVTCKLVQTVSQSGKVDVLFVLIQHLEEVLPDLLPGRPCECFVIECDLDARLERFVERSNAVAGEHEYAVIVLQHAEEDCGSYELDGLEG